MKTLGFIGTGGMGSGMAANLIKAGNKLVVNDLRREQARGLENQGALFKASPREVAEASEVVLSMLPYNEAVRTVGLGTGGLHEASNGAKLWIDFSSIDKKTIVTVKFSVYPDSATAQASFTAPEDGTPAAGTPADWYALCQGPRGWTSWDGRSKWKSGIRPYLKKTATNSGLVELRSNTVFSGRLAKGRYTYWVELVTADGEYTDSVPVNVTTR